jgi:hypothetical protein
MDERGNTLLRAACSGLNDDVPLYLLDNGAEVLLADNGDRSVLTKLIRGIGGRSCRLIRRLVEDIRRAGRDPFRRRED